MNNFFIMKHELSINTRLPHFVGQDGSKFTTIIGVIGIPIGISCGFALVSGTYIDINYGLFEYEVAGDITENRIQEIVDIIMCKARKISYIELENNGEPVGNSNIIFRFVMNGDIEINIKKSICNFGKIEISISDTAIKDICNTGDTYSYSYGIAHNIIKIIGENPQVARIKSAQFICGTF